MEENFDDLNHEQKLRVTIHSDVLKTVKEVGAEINMEVDKTAVSLVAELVWKKMEVISQDLELFARHAKRTTINTDDVKLLLRRNPSLRTKVCQMVDDAAKKKQENKEKVGEEKESESVESDLNKTS